MHPVIGSAQAEGVENRPVPSVADGDVEVAQRGLIDDKPVLEMEGGGDGFFDVGPASQAGAPQVRLPGDAGTWSAGAVIVIDNRDGTLV